MNMNRRDRRAAKAAVDAGENPTNRTKTSHAKNYGPQVRNPKPAYEVVFAHAHFRETEHETGIGCVVDFHGHPGDGIEFCRDLERRARDYDASGIKRSVFLDTLRRLSARSLTLTRDEQAMAFDAIYWLESRGHLKSDEHNGCVFSWIVGTTLCSGEQNPVLIDPVAAAFDGRGIDATEAMSAATTLADPAGNALRAIADHARAQPPSRSPLKTYYMILSARTHAGLVHHRFHALLAHDPRKYIPSEQEKFVAKMTLHCGLGPADVLDDGAPPITLGIWVSEDECVAAYRETCMLTNASPLPEHGPASYSTDTAGHYGRSKS
jgi:hypothetical protein